MNVIRLKQDLTVTVIGELLAKIPLYGFEFLLASSLMLDQYAEWVALGLFYRMAPYAHLGALSYFNKCYPMLLGEGNLLAAEEIKYHTNTAVNSLIFFSFFFTLLLLSLHCLSPHIFIVICSILIMQIFTYCQAKSRNDGDFYGYTIGLIIFSVSQFLFAYFTVQKYGVLSGIISTFLAYFLAVLYYIKILKIDYGLFVPSRKVFSKVLKLGYPPFFLTVSSFLTQISDRIALMLTDDDKKIAFYGFFALFFQVGIVVINSLGKVLGPYVLHLSSKKKIPDTLSISLSTCYIILAIYFCMSIVLIISGNWLIEHYFITFRGGLLGVYNYTSIGILTSLTLAFYPQLIAVSKEFIIIIINICYFFLSLIVTYFLSRNYEGFELYSFGSFLMNVAYSLIFLMVVENVMNKKIYVIRFTIFFIFILTVIVNYF